MDILGLPIIAMLVMLGVLVLVHECGHYLVGRYCGLAIESFSIGFGPQVIGFTKNHTVYRIGLLPLGGYVKFVGLIPGEEYPKHIPGIPFNKAERWKRVVTVAAGPVANLILAFAIYTTLAMAGIQYHASVVGFVMHDSPAEKAGLMVGDKITKIDDVNIRNWEDLNKLVQKSMGKPLNFEVLRPVRDGSAKAVTMSITPDETDGIDLLGRKKKVGRIGIGSGVVPAVVTVIDPNSPAAKIGFLTGDKVKRISIAGVDQDVIDFDGFKNSYASWLKADGDSPFVLSVERSEATAAKNPKLEVFILENKVALDAIGLAPSQTTVAEAKENLAGVFKKGDVILSMDGKKVSTVFDMYDILEDYQKPEMNVVLSREGQTRKMDIQLQEQFVQKAEGRVRIFTLPVSFLGAPVTPPMQTQTYSNPFAAALFGLERTAKDTGYISYTLFKLVTGDVPLKSLGGPILIAKVAGDSAKMGWRAFVFAMALISINLAVINLFPIPALDGGQLVLIGYESLRGKPLSEPAMENFQKVGFVMIMALIVLAFSNDLSRFWADILHSVAESF